jgi:hypothetical protein
MKTLTKTTVLAALCLLAQNAFAELTPEQAASLGGDELTPIGAERAGNEAGTIPAWTGGLTDLPAGYVEGEPLVDPFPNEKPLFTITAQNSTRRISPQDRLHSCSATRTHTACRCTQRIAPQPTRRQCTRLLSKMP